LRDPCEDLQTTPHILEGDIDHLDGIEGFGGAIVVRYITPNLEVATVFVVLQGKDGALALPATKATNRAWSNAVGREAKAIENTLGSVVHYQVTSAVHLDRLDYHTLHGVQAIAVNILGFTAINVHGTTFLAMVYLTILIC